MTVRAYYRDDLALKQLETALFIYFNGTDYASVITLAGAADEIFGRLIVANGKENSFESIKKAVSAIHQKLYGEDIDPSQIAERVNRARNSLKHWNQTQPLIVKLDLVQEAKDMLSRAIDNYWILREELTPEMERFQREQRQN